MIVLKAPRGQSVILIAIKDDRERIVRHQEIVLPSLSASETVLNVAVALRDANDRGYDEGSEVPC
jgi:hypothetical protein